MLVSLKNLVRNDNPAVLLGLEEIERFHMINDFCNVYLRSKLIKHEETTETLYLVALIAPIGKDCVVHFKDKEKAEDFYDCLVRNWLREDVLEIDVLEHGAI